MTIPAPPGFPSVTLQAQRALCVLEATYPQPIPTAFDVLYHSLWVDANGDIHKPEVFGPILDKAIGNDITKKIIEERGSKSAKDRLAANTDQAMNSGAFGIPWWECTNEEGKTETFWGFDHLGMVTRFLELDGKLKAQKSEGMRAIL
jgi:2-hydroxychromene-2-carboxylate isomerase